MAVTPSALEQRSAPLSVSQQGSSPTIVHFIIVFDVLYILGLISLGGILVTAWRSSNIKRVSTWFMFVFAWFFTSLSNLIILGQQTGPAPSSGVCLLQAMLIYGMPTFSSLYAVAFMLQVYLSIRVTQTGNTLSRTKMMLIHALPCVTFLGVLVEVLLLGVTSPSMIQRDPTMMFCHLSSGIPSKVTAGITIVAMTVFMTLGFRVYVTLRRTWRASATAQFKYQLSPSVVTRVLVFSFCPPIALAVSFVQYLPTNTSVDVQSRLNIVLAALPLIAGLIFGSQQDIIQAWSIFRCNRQSNFSHRSAVMPAAA